MSKVAIIFTYGMSLSKWKELGIHSRETERYRRLQHQLGQVIFLTYDRHLPELADDEPWRVLLNRFHLPNFIYSLIAPLLHWRTLRTVDFILTHQMGGGWTALIAKFLFKKTLIVRVGYFLSEKFRFQKRRWPFRKAVDSLERVVYRFADGVISTVEPGRRTSIPPWKRIALIPNGIDTNLFKPKEGVRRDAPTVCFVGRLSPQKNLSLLLEATQGLTAQILFVGDGPERQTLEIEAKRRAIATEFHGFVPNHLLPSILQRSDIFVLPSVWEGNPKALLEAMSCGLAVISTRWEGSEDIIEDGLNGLLCNHTAEALRTILERLLLDSALRQRLGAAARETILQRCSMEMTVERESRFILSTKQKLPAVQDRRVRWIASHLNSGCILDVGFAAAHTPYLHQYIKERGTVFGVDINEENVRQHNFPLSTVGDGFALGFRSNTFNTVILAEVVEHIEQPAALLDETIRVLRPGGKLILTTPNPFSVTRWMRHYLLNAEPSRPRFWQGFLGDEDHLALWEPLSLCGMLERRGLKVEELRSVGFSLPVGRLRRLLAAALDRNFLPLNRIASFTCIAATKPDTV